MENKEVDKSEAVLYVNDSVKDDVKDRSGDFTSNETKKIQQNLLTAKSNVSSYRSIYNPCMADTHTRIFGECPTPRSVPQSPRQSNVSVMKPPDEKFERALYSKKPVDGNPLTGEGYGNDPAEQKMKYSSGRSSYG